MHCTSNVLVIDKERKPCAHDDEQWTQRIIKIQINQMLWLSEFRNSKVSKQCEEPQALDQSKRVQTNN